MSDVRTMLVRGVGGATPPPDGFERMLRRRDRKRRNQRITAGIVGIAVFVAAIWIIATGGPFDRTLTPGGGGGTEPTGEPEPTVAPEAGGIVGLPAPGAAPSTPEHGRLVLYLEGSAGGPFTAVWVYDDGRLIWGDMGNLPDGAPTKGATGFVEQRLTPGGIEFLRSRIVSTGLFERDLELLREPNSPFLSIEVRNGDRLVQVRWAWRGALMDPDTASPATPEQASALEGIYGLLSDPMSLPASAWEDQDLETFVPSRYQVWLRLFPDHGPGPNLPVGTREWALLPAPATDLLRLGTKLNSAFYELTTDDARALAEALNEAGLEPLAVPMGEAVVRYTLEDPYAPPGHSLYVFFGPVLPHGEAIFLGPG